MRTPAVVLLLVALPAAATSQVVRQPFQGRGMVAVPVGAPPGGVRTGSTPGSIIVHWGCPEGASGYDVYATPADGGQVKLNPSPIPGQCVQDLQVAMRPMPGVRRRRTPRASRTSVRAGTPTGPFYPMTEYPGRSADFVRIVGNPVGVLQYYKLQAMYPTGVTESVVVPITIPMDAKGFEDFPTRFVTPVKEVTLEWQCPR